MKQIGKILKFELRAYWKNKAFVGVTILLVVILAIVMSFPRITALFDTEKEESTQAQATLLVKAADAASGEMVKQTFAAAFPEYNVVLTDANTDDIKEQVLSQEADGAFVLQGPTSYTYYVNNLSLYDANEAVANSVLQKVYQMQAMMTHGMSPEQASQIMSIQITSQVETLGKDQSQNFFYTYIMIFALYMVILLYGQMVAMNVATEKSSRAMELLITSAKPTAMMFGKVIASCIAGLIQLIAIFGSALLFYHLNKTYWDAGGIMDSLFNIPPALFGYMLVFFLLGFLIYAFLYGSIASTVSKLEDINTAVQPVTFLFLFGFMVVIFSMTGADVDNMLMKVCSYIPFTSPMAMFTRIAMSTVPWYEIVLSISLLVGSTIGIGFLSARIYRVGVLLYGNKPTIRSILKHIRKS